MTTFFNSIRDFEKYLNEQMAKVLITDVAQVVKNKEQEKVITEVYDKYQPGTPDHEPWVYKRRGWQGGLADQSNMNSYVTNTLGGVELTVENVTKGQDDTNLNIADLVEYGDNQGHGQYDYKKNRDGTANEYLAARPFQEDTVTELEMTGEHIDAFKLGMRRQGINLD